MKIAVRLMAIATGLLAAQVAVAQAPAGSTGVCKDGTYSQAASKSGACRGHQGVKEWYASASAPVAAATAPAAAAKSAPASAASAAKSTAPVAAASGPPPAGSTGACKDGTYTSAA